MDNQVLTNMAVKLANEAIQSSQLQAQVKQLQKENEQLKKLVADKNAKPKSKEEGD